MKTNQPIISEDKVEKELPKKHAGIISEFFWICAGANRKILRQCPTDYAKYAGIGGTILFTAIMAMFSGGYALYFVFNSQKLAILFGFFWGLLIFNLDRLIVNTMYSDGKVTISWMEFTSGLPRIIIAIFLGIVISTPLEMKMFEDSIDRQLIINKSKQTTLALESVNTQNKLLIEERDKLQNKKDDIELRLQKVNEEIADEEAGIRSGIIGRGPKYRGLLELKKSIELEKNNYEANESDRLEQLKVRIQQSNDEAVEQNRDIINGFAERFQAFSDVKKGDKSLSLVSILISLLFITIEVAPTIFKMMIASGPYDDILNAENHRIKVLSDKKISDINDNINTEVAISTDKNRLRLEAELAANKELMTKIANAQAELLHTAIDEWKKSELAKIKENPSIYIESERK